MQKISTHLWFDKEAKEAAEFYLSVFGGGRIKSITTLENTPSGSVDVVNMELRSADFTLISAGPLFKFNPSISFTVPCKTEEEVNEIWNKLAPGGFVMMELGSYPFSPKYGWLADKYGLSWQIILEDSHYAYKQRITPTLMFVGAVAGKAEEAMNFYASIFPDSKVGDMARYPAGSEYDKEGTVMHGVVTLAGQDFFAMDSAHPEHKFNFNEAISLVVTCKDQKELDYYWDKLSAVPESEQCGWLKDKFGVSWQIVPEGMNKMMASGDKKKMAKVTEAFLKMKKFDIAKLEEVYNQN